MNENLYRVIIHFRGAPPAQLGLLPLTVVSTLIRGTGIQAFTPESGLGRHVRVNLDDVTLVDATPAEPEELEHLDPELRKMLAATNDA